MVGMSNEVWPSLQVGTILWQRYFQTAGSAIEAGPADSDCARLTDDHEVIMS